MVWTWLGKTVSPSGRCNQHTQRCPDKQSAVRSQLSHRKNAGINHILIKCVFYIKPGGSVVYNLPSWLRTYVSPNPWRKKNWYNLKNTGIFCLNLYSLRYVRLFIFSLPPCKYKTEWESESVACNYNNFCMYSAVGGFTRIFQWLWMKMFYQYVLPIKFFSWSV